MTELCYDCRDVDNSVKFIYKREPLMIGLGIEVTQCVMRYLENAAVLNTKKSRKFSEQNKHRTKLITSRINGTVIKMGVNTIIHMLGILSDDNDAE